MTKNIKKLIKKSFEKIKKYDINIMNSYTK